MHNTGIYEIRNMVNGKLYVGSASSLKAREGQHFRSLARGRHHSIALQRAWNMYGPDAFVFRPMIYCDQSNLLVYEQAMIDGLRPEYNIAPVAGSQLGYKHRPESRQKMSIARRMNPSSPRKGMKHTEEAKRKISENRRGKGGGPRSPERLAKISAALKGRVISVATRAKIAESLRGKPGGKGMLSEDQVREIRNMHKSGISVPEIGRRLGIRRQNVSVVTTDRAYRWVK
jgi:group I intron endonuclease